MGKCRSIAGGIAAAGFVASCNYTEPPPVAPVVAVEVAPPPVTPSARPDPLPAPPEVTRADANAKPVPVDVPRLGPRAPIPPAITQKLRSGLTWAIFIDLETTMPGQPPTLSVVGTCLVSFDLWNDVYSVRVPGPAQASAPQRTVAVIDEQRVVDVCTDRTAYSAAVANAPPGAKLQRALRVK